jgi:hypothetical protein
LYQLGRGSDPMIDVGMTTPAEPLIMTASPFLSAALWGALFHSATAVAIVCHLLQSWLG